MRDNSQDYDVNEATEPEFDLDSLFRANRATRRLCAREKHPYFRAKGYCTNCGVNLDS